MQSEFTIGIEEEYLLVDRDSLALAARIVDDLEAAPETSRAGHEGLGLTCETVDHAGWQRLDAIEKAQAMAGRCRTKIPTRPDMLRLAQKIEELK